MGCSGSHDANADRRADLFFQWVQSLASIDEQEKVSTASYLKACGVDKIVGQAVKALALEKPTNVIESLIASLREVQRSEQLSCVDPPLKQEEKKRLLVFTDVGEEVDDEAALWLLSQHCDHPSAKYCDVDVVFTTGQPRQRAMRWASLLNSINGPKPGADQISYFLGPETSRHMRYRLHLDSEELESSGIGELPAFQGGSYDVILQMSPIDGFSADFVLPPSDSSGALARISTRSSTQRPLYICVGLEGSTNFPKNELHIGFKKYLTSLGFADVHIQNMNYVPWQECYFDRMPQALVQLVLDDEWHKAVGRIGPNAASLLVRFRVNVSVNYALVSKAFAMFHKTYSRTTNFSRALEWWSTNAEQVYAMIREGYVRESRENDDRATFAYGNPTVIENVKGASNTWVSLLSVDCKTDIMQQTSISEEALNSMNVDDIMCWAVTLMTGRLLTIYAYNAYEHDCEPSSDEYVPYIRGRENTKQFSLAVLSKSSSQSKLDAVGESIAPLDYRNFPRLLGDMSAIKKEVVGSPMYDPAGMLVALLSMQAGTSDIDVFIQKLNKMEPLLDKTQRVRAMKAAYAGVGPLNLVERFVHREEQATPRILVLTQGGGKADDEAALWLLLKYLSAKGNEFRADVVFMTGDPLQGAVRWASVLNSVKSELPLNSECITYMLGPESSRSRKYTSHVDSNVLRDVGMAELHSSFFDGGTYDVILQCCPLGNSSSDFANPPEGVAGALGRVHCRARCQAPVYLIVGKAGSLNFPDDKLHNGFKEALERRGFVAIHLQSSNTPRWKTSLLNLMPYQIQHVVLQDEWNKALDHAPRSETNLLDMFRRTTKIKYDLVHRAWQAFSSASSESEAFDDAHEWWESIRSEVKEMLRDNYTSLLQRNDLADNDAAYGNPFVSKVVRGTLHTWKSIISPTCVDDILSNVCGNSEVKFDSMTVLEVIESATFTMVGQLLKLYAADCIMTHRVINERLLFSYLAGDGERFPLDFRLFPRIHGLSYVKSAVLGSRMYDTSGMLIAVAAMQWNNEQRDELEVQEKEVSKSLQIGSTTDQSLADIRADMMKQVCNGAPATVILRQLCPHSLFGRVSSLTPAKADGCGSNRSIIFARLKDNHSWLLLFILVLFHSLLSFACCFAAPGEFAPLLADSAIVSGSLEDMTFSKGLGDLLRVCVCVSSCLLECRLEKTISTRIRGLRASSVAETVQVHLLGRG
eukprot:TRINITY_DN6331_c0_g4_i1.p1 TRINITY_DN6331_c0_g4~~TRINITY_DN6331_c0_g4_i1.p1  ORF type:complete len:1210 (+),score=108.96 TRINITY_DN6331_c0_g4_i1:32-3661(+)